MSLGVTSLVRFVNQPENVSFLQGVSKDTSKPYSFTTIKLTVYDPTSCNRDVLEQTGVVFLTQDQISYTLPNNIVPPSGYYLLWTAFILDNRGLPFFSKYPQRAFVPIRSPLLEQFQAVLSQFPVIFGNIPSLSPVPPAPAPAPRTDRTDLEPHDYEDVV